MKYLFLLVLLSSCATAKPKPLTLDNCVADIKERIDYKENIKNKSASDIAFADFGIAYMCNQNGNDPDKTMKAVEDLPEDTK